MPIFKNISGSTLSFEVGKERFDVPPGESCEIPRALAYVVEARGLPLVRHAGEATVEATDARPAPARLPPGVENVGADPDEDEPNEAEGAEGVDAALAAQGVRASGAKKRR